MKKLVLSRAALAAVVCIGGQSAQAYDLMALINGAPAGGWVQLNTGALSESFVTDPVPVGNGIYEPKNVVYAWSSMAWDSTRNNMLLWGGGHASHSGNEMYVWSGSTGRWSLGSLPSALERTSETGDSRTLLVVDHAAPQSSHTYEGNLYLPLNDRFITFGGPAYDNAATFLVRNSSGQLENAGPWMWDPSKADPTKVGGTTGSGWNPNTLGGNMWTNRMPHTSWNGTQYNVGFINNTTAYRAENGRDVVYMTAYDSGAWPSLFRYTVGNLAAGEGDTWELVGVTTSAPSTQASGTIDDANALYVHTTTHPSTSYDLNVWDITRSGHTNADTGIFLAMADGTAFDIDETYAIDYNSADGSLYLWSGEQGTVYRTRAEFNPDGSVANTWTVEVLLSTSAENPEGSFRYGVQGKWEYVDSLGVFVALDEYNELTGDAGVWVYKPGSSLREPRPSVLRVPRDAPDRLNELWTLDATDTLALTAPVPEPGTVGLMLAGLGWLAFVGRRAARRSETGLG